MMTSRLAHIALAEAYLELTPAQKKVWNLCKRQGLSEEAAAVKLNVSRASVQDRLTAASKKFKKHLESIKETYDA